jgi:hypothetical protein
LNNSIRGKSRVEFYFSPWLFVKSCSDIIGDFIMNRVQEKKDIKVVLHKFYDNDDYTEEFLSITNSEADRIYLKEALPILQKIVDQHGSVYDRIELELYRDYNGEYVDHPEIVGIRKETDEEFKTRLDKIEQDKLKRIKDKENMKLAKEAKKAQKEKELLEELKAKYEIK